ncbi:MAG: sigma-70 family RNA polymerase sigma factor [Planctomycetes bacterium]|nr:sigma-70 family RNA polymerase sigma factor [Planctomycetota bacterium]
MAFKMPQNARSNPASDSAREDARLIAAFISGPEEERAFQDLHRKYWKVVVGWILAKVINLSDAEELAQDTFVRAFRSLKSLESPRSFLAWILRIAANLTTDFLRRKKKDSLSLDSLMEKGLLPFVAESSGEGEREVEEREQVHAVLEAVARLPEKYRLVITLRYQMGLSAKQIAVQLHEPEGTIRNRIFRALAKVRRSLDPSRAGGSPGRAGDCPGRERDWRKGPDSREPSPEKARKLEQKERVPVKLADAGGPEVGRRGLLKSRREGPPPDMTAMIKGPESEHP